MSRLLQDVERALHDGHYNHVGSAALWAHHGDMVTRMKNSLNAVQLKQVSKEPKSVQVVAHLASSFR